MLRCVEALQGSAGEPWEAGNEPDDWDDGRLGKSMNSKKPLVAFCYY